MGTSRVWLQLKFTCSYSLSRRMLCPCLTFEESYYGYDYYCPRSHRRPPSNGEMRNVQENIANRPTISVRMMRWVTHVKWYWHSGYNNCFRSPITCHIEISILNGRPRSLPNEHIGTEQKRKKRKRKHPLTSRISINSTTEEAHVISITIFDWF